MGLPTIRSVPRLSNPSYSSRSSLEKIEVLKLVDHLNLPKTTLVVCISKSIPSFLKRPVFLVMVPNPESIGSWVLNKSLLVSFLQTSTVAIIRPLKKVPSTPRLVELDSSQVRRSLPSWTYLNAPFPKYCPPVPTKDLD